MADSPITLRKGDYGVLIHQDETIDLLLPAGAEKRPLTEAHQALIGATIGVLMDEAFRAYALRTGRTYALAEPGPNGEN